MSFPESGGEDFNDFITGDDPDYDWAIPGLLERGDRAILTGGEGKGKSTLTRQIGAQVAGGVHPFTLEDIEPQRVMFIDLENPRRTTRREIKKFYSELEIERGYLTIYSWPGGLDLLHADQQIALTQKFREVQPQLVIIGPMYKMTALPLEKEENSKILAAYLDNSRAAFNFALIMESHQPHGTVVQKSEAGSKPFYRPERPVGSSLWLRWPEFGYCLEDGGLLRPWRGGRDRDRQWPDKLIQGDEWPWMVDERKCLKCGKPLTQRQEKYCSEACGNAARQATHRRKAVGLDTPIRLFK